MKEIFLSVICISVLLQISLCQDRFQAIADPLSYADLICSYHGKYDKTEYNNNKLITCICNEAYTNSTKNLEFVLFNKVLPIQCDYKRKRKFLHVFLALVQPFGFDLLYLGYVYWFVIHFLFSLVTIIGNFWRYVYTSEKNYFQDKLNLGFFVLLIILICAYLIKIGLAFSNIKDSEGIELVNDLNYLISVD